jgi:multiple sugar transport system substrate-binding protein
MSEKCVSKTQVGEASDTNDGTRKYSRRNFRETAPATGVVGAAVGLADRSGNGGDGGSDGTITWDSIFQEWEAGIQGRSLPNVSEMVSERAVNFGYQGAAEPTTDLFNEHDGWYETVSNWGRFNGEFWGLPRFIRPRTSHVNRDILEQAGVDSPPETWKEIVTKGQAIAENTDVSAA